ncbi:MAG: hypothetical protein HKP23_06045 [Flavobacteriaceae bacterium]|nr:hypothetical protein [Eudoraea sp.]NNJ38788.1 hypothetical protein [Flavobacteriaceae bacterium]
MTYYLASELLNPETVIAIVIFVISIALVIFLRRKVGQGYEIKISDVVLALIPLVIWLLLTDKIKTFKYGDLEFTLSDKIEAAQQSPLSESEELIDMINPKEIEINLAEKATEGALVDILRAKPEGLIFKAGYKNYGAAEIESYLKTLSQSTLKYILIFDNDSDDFLGLISLENFMAQVFAPNSNLSPATVAQLLRDNDRDRLKEISGMLTAEEAITPETAKYEALTEMQKLGTVFLPVTKEGKFMGVVEMQKLTNSLLIDISQKLSEVK